MDDANPIRRRKLSDDVRDCLLAVIEEEGLGPGDALPSERELMARYGVGRPAIREAMQSLQSHGLIEVRHGGRPRVAHASAGAAFDRIGLTMRHVLSHSAPTLEHLKEVRVATERHLAGVAAERRGAADLAQLRTALDAQVAATGEPEAFLRCDGRFHEVIAETSGNPVFTAVCRAIFGWLAEFHVDLVHRPGLEALTIEEHEGILATITAGDANAASHRMATHLLRANALYAQEHRRSG